MPMIVPNKDRVLIRKVANEEAQSANILLPGQLKVGENLYAGEVIHAGESALRVGSLVFFSEFSAAGVTDLGAVLRKEKQLSEVMNGENILYVVAEDDIMAYDDSFTFKV